MCLPRLVREVLAAAHDDGHEGIQKSLHRLRRDFHLPQARSALQHYIRACTVCQRNKTEQLHPARLLQPFTVPSRVWEDISMELIEALPKVGGKCHPYSGGSFLQVCPFYSFGTSIYCCDGC
jgi:hypothetical protein